MRIRLVGLHSWTEIKTNSGRSSVTMMQPADHRNRDHPPPLAWLDLARNRKVPIEGKMCSCVVVVFKVRSEDPHLLEEAERLLWSREDLANVRIHAADLAANSS